MPQKILTLSEAPLSNDYLFGEVMSQSKVCKLFLEELLRTEIEEIVYIGKQEEIRGGLASHTIRLDVYVKDEAGTRYNIEMQVVRRRHMERRVRSYQSGIDHDSLKKGMTNDDTAPTGSTLMGEVKAAVDGVRHNETKEMEFMTLEMKMHDVRMDGVEEGIAKGLEKGIEAMIVSLRELSVDDAAIEKMLCKQFALSEEQAKIMLERYRST